ncbi:MAG: phosphoglucosamine mutase [Bacteroidetes bacterium]|nr:phosphoglucosamine mutase [Bacteroidota bacterium]
MSTLMVSVSGIRGIVGNGLDPNVIVKYASAYADFCGKGKIIVGSDGRITGDMVKNVLVGTLLAKGNDVVDIGICPTPTVLYNVTKLGAVGGIAISASHNPNEWNALKLLNGKGEFLTLEENAKMMAMLDSTMNSYRKWDQLGFLKEYGEGLQNHMEEVLKLKLIDQEALRKRNFKVLLDCVNGAGAYIMPQLLAELGCEVVEMHCDKTGIFPRLPEPIPENLVDTMQAVMDNNVDIGIVVDPDVDRLVLLTNEGNTFVEENTIVQATKFIISKQPGNVVVNLSTTRGVEDIANMYSSKLYRTPVGEANVVAGMKKYNAVIGGEGSGGVIYPELQYGRDALVGTAITLQHLLEFGGTSAELKNSLPKYEIVKKKINVGESNPDEVISILTDKYSYAKFNNDDGLRVDFDDHWFHLRKSNTEPIIRCIVEARDNKLAEKYSLAYMKEIKSALK